MDSDKEEEQMFAELLEEETDAAAQDEEHLLILACLSGLYAESVIGHRGGSAPGRRKCKPRQRMEGYCMLYADYFADDPLHGEAVFRRRFRMSRKLFLKIVYALRDYDSYFRCKLDCTRMAGFSALQKCTVAMRMLAYGAPGDSADDYLRIAESTALDCFYRFCRAVIAVFGDFYLRSPTLEDTSKILTFSEARGFPGMLGSIDFMHWKWKNCPFAWQGIYKGHKKGCTVILEAVATHDLWIWHSFFGMPGSNNDINVDVGITLRDSINPKSLSEDIAEEHPRQLAPSVGNLLAQDQSSSDPIMSSTSSSAPPSPTLGGPVRFGSYEFTPHSDSSRSNFSDLQGNMEMTIGSVHYNVNAEGVLQLLELPTSGSTSPSASSSLDLLAGLTESMSSPAPSTPRSASSMSVGSDEPTSSELTSYYCSNCDARHGLGSSDTPFICNARYSSGEDSVGSIARRATRRTAHHQVYVANNTGNTRHGGDGDRTPRSSRRASFENSASNRGTATIPSDEEGLPGQPYLTTPRSPQNLERSSERRRASRSALGAGKHRSRLSRLSEDDAREITSNLTKSFMTTDTAGMPRPKNVAGPTANLAAYLINQRPEGSMAQAHRGALESLTILGNNLVPQKEKTTAQASGSKHRARDARDEITQSRIDKARRRCAARKDDDSDSSYED
ncbi:hypothetical protein QYE76_054245 [Lolium multiflorum]|uniref:Uncharacterized protein n=1 Tax=Lolium multiflorum TaxID=4521 RepID=A0AAD8WL68_LOLMU|nr:hypothetical protein QYE76_054245 [Lolium multiflorum]